MHNRVFHRRLNNGVDEKEWDLYRYTVNRVSRYDTEIITFFKRMLQRELPFGIRQRVTSSLFEKYVGITEKVFSEQLYMSVDDVKVLLSEGMFVGSHTYNHNWLTAIDEKQQELEIS